MSELKEHRIVGMNEECARVENDYYIKSEADKVIAEKDAVIAELKAKLEGAKNETNYWCNNLKVFAQKKDAEIAELKNEIEEQKRLRDMALASVPNVLKIMKIIQHQKYKRCLAMAKYCELREDEFGGDFAKRWLKKWLELAEEPTWAKFLQLIRKEAK